tara:strand:- start:143 stop:580 length:438 start_codon:yes stop_codon:yes gene_type:complete
MTIDAHQSARGFAERISEETLPPFCLVPETNAYWSARPKQHFLPGKKDTDPVDLGAKLLARLFLADVVNADAGMVSRFLLAGTSNVRLISIERRGRMQLHDGWIPRYPRGTSGKVLVWQDIGRPPVRLSRIVSPGVGRHACRHAC